MTRRLLIPVLAALAVGAIAGAGAALAHSLYWGGDPASQFYAGHLHTDTEDGGGGNDIMEGQLDDDSIDGELDDDEAYGGGGADSIDGSGGHDLVAGDNGADNVLGGAGEEIAEGGDGEDTLNTHEGGDTLLAEDGTRDEVRGGADADICAVDAIDIAYSCSDPDGTPIDFP